MEEDRILIGIDFSNASKEVIELLIEDASETSIFEEIAKANMNRPEILTLLLENPDIPDEVRQQVAGALQVAVKARSEIVKVKKSPEVRTQTILQKIQKLSVSNKIHLALRGGKEIRSILLRDPSKEVVLTVLENPKLTETEIELISKSRSIPDEVLRKITKKREWMRNYNVILGLVTNPKTPPGISVVLVNELKTRDLAILEKNKNVIEGVRATAKKILRARKAH
ncbi:MAG: hypothetical protein Q8P40_13795 [Nitrospirota bacterium]|nr:hypothetical protein [Nitrospirota bacterium]